MPQQHSPAKTMSSDPEHNDRSKLARGLNNRKLLDLVREAVLLVDLSGEIVFWNQGAEQLYGWNANEALGQSPLELLQTELLRDRKSTRLNSSHSQISYAVFCLKKKK